MSDWQLRRRSAQQVRKASAAAITPAPTWFATRVL